MAANGKFCRCDYTRSWKQEISKRHANPERCFCKWKTCGHFTCGMVEVSGHQMNKNTSNKTLQREELPEQRQHQIACPRFK